MDITFLAPCKDLSGGIKVIATYGNLLVEKGHNVTVIYPQIPHPFSRKVKRYILSKISNNKDHLDYFKGTLKQVKTITSTTIPNGDILVATAWETAEWAKDLAPENGKKFYLVQGYEVWNADRERVEETFRWPFRKIVISNWLKEKIREIDNQNEISLIQNGADFNYTFDQVSTIHRQYTAGMTWSNIPNKNCTIGLDAIRLLSENIPGSRFVIFGSEKPGITLPANIDFYLRPSPKKIKDIYLSTRVWLSTSNFEGFCLPCLEALSSGSIPISTDSLGVRDIIDDGKNGYIIERGNTASLYKKTFDLVTDDIKRMKFMKAGIDKAHIFSWNDSVDQMESLFMDAMETE